MYVSVDLAAYLYEVDFRLHGIYIVVAFVHQLIIKFSVLTHFTGQQYRSKGSAYQNEVTEHVSILITVKIKTTCILRF